MRTVMTALTCLLLSAGCKKDKNDATGVDTRADTQAAAAQSATSPSASAETTSGATATEDAATTTDSHADERNVTATAVGKVIEIKTSLGTITAELYADKAPKTVANFLQYVKDGHYDGTIFHRVIDNFMIQGGGFDGSFSKKPTREPVENEADNGLKNAVGTLAMARTPDPHSASAQFFINTKDNEFLNFRSKTPDGWGYTVFGKVTQGMDIVKKISKVRTGSKGPFARDAPQENVEIQSIKIVK